VLDRKLLDDSWRRLERESERTKMSAALVSVTEGQSNLAVAGT
jgi:hypothetical protein